MSFYLDFIQILSKFYKIMIKSGYDLDKVFFPTLFKFHPDFIQMFSKIKIKSG